MGAERYTACMKAYVPLLYKTISASVCGLLGGWITSATQLSGAGEALKGHPVHELFSGYLQALGVNPQDTNPKPV